MFIVKSVIFRNTHTHKLEHLLTLPLLVRTVEQIRGAGAHQAAVKALSGAWALRVHALCCLLSCAHSSQLSLSERTGLKTALQLSPSLVQLITDPSTSLAVAETSLGTGGAVVCVWHCQTIAY